MKIYITFALLFLMTALQAPADDLAKGFLHPPDSARPWVYWFWLNGNITREGITADLEAMRRVGIGGALIMEVDQGSPKGPVGFGSPQWRELFKHVVSEADRLGLEINMNNDAGWCGSGGPWITPDLSMQKVVWSETQVAGPMRFDGALPEPKKVAGAYHDIAVLAFPTPDGYRIEDIAGKSALIRQEIATQPKYPAIPAGAAIPPDRVIELTTRMDANGHLVWDAPAGNWTLLRIGHTPTGANNQPAPLDGRGLDCDKLSKEATEAHFNGLMAKLIADVGPLAGKTLVRTHIDSWEVGSQNWTPRFREEFQRLRGYDPLRFLPVMTGRVVDSLEVSERFLWDVRQTVSDLLVDNYAGHFRDLAHRSGLQLSIEAYDGSPTDDMAYAGRADEVMSEFWSWPSNFTSYSDTEMASAAHTYGKKILGAEAFTATDGEMWQHHPASIKALGDWAFCEGINRFVFHRYAMQPWLNVKPGMSMGPWGLHYERTETWWEQSAAWHEYLSRCQFLLQQGLFIADICFLEPEGSPQRFHLPASYLQSHGPERAKYNFDGCTPEVVLTRMTVKDGRIVLPDGMSYRVLVLPEVQTMTPRLLRKILELVQAGATVIGAPPSKSPSLGGYPQCDQETKELADRLWANCNGTSVKEHRFGKGKVIWGKAVEEVLAEMGVRPDFTYSCKSGGQNLRYIHKTIGDADVYFVANKNNRPEETVCAFRAHGKRAELWWPDTGRIAAPAVYDESGGIVRIPIRFDQTGSVFVVFRPSHGADASRITSVSRDGKTLMDTAWKPGKEQPSDNNRNVTNTFTMAAWIKPEVAIGLPEEANTGATGLSVDRNDAIYPPPGHEVYPEQGHSGAGISVGTNGVCVYEHSANYFAPLLVYNGPITGWTYVAVVYRDRETSLYINGKLVHKGLRSTFIVHPGVGVQHTRSVEPFRGDIGAFQQSNRALTDEEIVKQMTSTQVPVDRQDDPTIEVIDNGRIEAQVWKPGVYTLKTATGKVSRFEVAALPKPLEIAGPWELRFPPNTGAPESVTLDKLISWSDHSDPGVKYFSGTATYRKRFDIPSGMIAADQRLYLDLGRVQVIAEVRLNGKNLGISWKPPYRLDVTDAVHVGENTLEVKVVNLWPNRMIGDERLPEDSNRNPDGTLKEWPHWVLDGGQSPTGRYTFSSWKLWKKDSPLLESGLLGPVVLRAVAKVTVAKP